MSCDFVFSMPFTGPFLKKKKKRRKRKNPAPLLPRAKMRHQKVTLMHFPFQSCNLLHHHELHVNVIFSTMAFIVYMLLLFEAKLKTTLNHLM